jgi:hypothetical protein
MYSSHVIASSFRAFAHSPSHSYTALHFLYSHCCSSPPSALPVHLGYSLEMPAIVCYLTDCALPHTGNHGVCAEGESLSPCRHSALHLSHLVYGPSQYSNQFPQHRSCPQLYSRPSHPCSRFPTVLVWNFELVFSTKLLFCHLC